MTDASSEWWRYLYEGVGVPVGDLDRLIDAIADRVPPPPRAVAADRPLVRKFIRAHILGAIKAGEEGYLDDVLAVPGDDQQQRAINAIASWMRSPFILPGFERFLPPEDLDTIEAASLWTVRRISPMSHLLMELIWTTLREGASSRPAKPRRNCEWCTHPGVHRSGCPARPGRPRRCVECPECETRAVEEFTQGLRFASEHGNLLVNMDKALLLLDGARSGESFVSVFPNLNTRKEHLLVTSKATTQFLPTVFGLKHSWRARHRFVKDVQSEHREQAGSIRHSIVIEMENAIYRFEFGTFSTEWPEKVLGEVAGQNAELALNQIKAEIAALS